MRWDNLKIIDPAAPDGMSMPLFEQGAVRRTFDTPEFRGITFYEVRARSIINHVPEASRVPFRWTINPYRGCSHSCFYCQVGDTPILMADGRTRPLAELRTGDRVYGTVRGATYRHYVVTEVLDHWETSKPAHLVTLEDGTELIASADHRYLTGRGWKHVAPSEVRGVQRPHVTTNNELLGTGRFAEPPKQLAEYQRGYLCGIVRGDGTLGSYSYPRPGRSSNEVFRFRLALADREALDRSRECLDDFGVATDVFAFQPEAPGRRAVTAIRTQRRAEVAAIEELIAWPLAATDEWRKGFLAGMFDAEGSCSRGVLRISNTDAEILGAVGHALTSLGFRWVLEPGRGDRPKPVSAIRLVGGLRERLRFFHSTDPAITRKRDIEGTAVKSDAPLRVTAVESLGFELPMFDITTGTGDFIANGVISHNCFARNTHTYLDMDVGEDFNRQIVVKVNAPDLLRKELSAKGWKGEHIAMGTNTDNYQRAEGRYRLMPGILEALRDFRNPFSILTKGSLILRDLPLLEECAEVTEVGANVSVGSVDRELWRLLEPGTPSPQKRLEVCRTLNEHGIPCGVLMAPIVPFISDAPSQLEATVKAIAEAGATHIAPIVLHLRTGAREWFMAWLAEHHPELVPRYEELYRRSSYAPKAFQAEITSRVHELAERYGVGKTSPKDTRHVRPMTPIIEPPEQLSII